MPIVIFVTCPNTKVATIIADSLVKEKLAACVNIVSGLTSIYEWKGKIEKAKEVLLVIKTQKKLFVKLEESIKKLHPYDVPEIIALPITAGNKPYLNWIQTTVKK